MESSKSLFNFHGICSKHNSEYIFVCENCSNKPICINCWDHHKTHNLNKYVNLESTNKKNFDENLELIKKLINFNITKYEGIFKKNIEYNRTKCLDNENGLMNLLSNTYHDKDNSNNKSSKDDIELSKYMIQLFKILKGLEEEKDIEVKFHLNKIKKCMFYHSKNVNKLIKNLDKFKVPKEKSNNHLTLPSFLPSFDTPLMKLKFNEVKQIMAMGIYDADDEVLYVSLLMDDDKTIVSKVTKDCKTENIATFSKPVHSLLRIKNDTLILYPDSLVKLDKDEEIVIAELENAVNAVLINKNTIICLEKNNVKKIMIDSECKMTNIINLGPSIDQEFCKYVNFTTYDKNQLALIDGLFGEGNCLWIYSQSKKQKTFAYGFGKAKKRNKKSGFINPVGISSIKNGGLLISDKKLKKIFVYKSCEDENPVYYSLDYQPTLIAVNEIHNRVYVCNSNREVYIY